MSCRWPCLLIIFSLQEVEKGYRGKLLNANELKTIINLLRTVAEDPTMQKTLDKLRSRGDISVVGLSGALVPLHHAVHAHTAPRILLQRYSIFVMKLYQE